MIICIRVVNIWIIILVYEYFFYIIKCVILLLCFFVIDYGREIRFENVCWSCYVVIILIDKGVYVLIKIVFIVKWFKKWKGYCK